MPVAVPTHLSCSVLAARSRDYESSILQRVLQVTIQ